MSEDTLPLRINTIKQSDAKAILLVANPDEAVAVVQELDRQQVQLPIYAHWGITGGRFWQKVAMQLQKMDVKFVQTVLLQNPNTKLQSVISRYHQRYFLASGAEQHFYSPSGTVQAYDLIKMLALAVQNSQSSNRESIRNALENLPSYNGLIRNYEPPFTAERHDALDITDMHLAKFNHKGEIVAAD